MQDTATFLACLGLALKLTDDTMRANLDALPSYHKDVDGPVPHNGQSAVKYVRVNVGFALDYAGPLVLQGAMTTCYCFLLYVAASVAVTLAAYAFVSVKAAARATIAKDDPIKALETPAKGSALLEAAIRTVFENTMASTAMLFQIAVAQAIVTIAALGALAAFVTFLKPAWAFLHKGVLYVDTRFLKQAGTATTVSALPFVGCVLFSRTDMWARWKAAVWRFLQ